jgi:DNA adenine methylase
MKYMGSKSRIAKHIVPIIQDYIDRHEVTHYVEPFVGGANVIQHIKCERRIGTDSNLYLTALLSHVAGADWKTPEEMALPDDISREMYNEVRANYKNGGFKEWFVGCVGFLASYNGRFFDGGYAQPGYETLKDGKKRFRNYYQESKANLLAQAPSLQGVSFGSCDYKDALSYGNDPKKRFITTNALYYCDPPYQNKKQYGEVKPKEWYDEFWQTMEKLSSEAIVIVSEENAPGNWTCIWAQEVSRSIKASDKSRSVEKLFMLNPKKYSEELI